MQMSIEELREMQKDRDGLVAEIARLKAKPEDGTLEDIGQRVVENCGSLTPDQERHIHRLIVNRGHKC